MPGCSVNGAIGCLPRGNAHQQFTLKLMHVKAKHVMCMLDLQVIRKACQLFVATAIVIGKSCTLGLSCGFPCITFFASMLHTLQGLPQDRTSEVCKSNKLQRQVRELVFAYLQPLMARLLVLLTSNA